MTVSFNGFASAAPAFKPVFGSFKKYTDAKPRTLKEERSTLIELWDESTVRILMETGLSEKEARTEARRLLVEGINAQNKIIPDRAK